MKLIYTRVFLVICFIVLCAGQSFGQLNAQFSANQTSGCFPLAVAFTDASTGSPNSWNWDFGDANSSTQQNPSHNYTSPGTYTVTLTVGNGTGTDTEIKTSYITVFTGPTASFTTVPDSVCSGGTITFTSTSLLFISGSGTSLYTNSLYFSSTRAFICNGVIVVKQMIKTNIIKS